MSTGGPACEGCGAENTAGARFCYGCGHRLQPTTPTSATPKRTFWEGFLWGMVGVPIPGVIGLLFLGAAMEPIAAIVIAVIALGLGVFFMARRSERPIAFAGGIVAGAALGVLGLLLILAGLIWVALSNFG